ncbi:phasin family protein [Ostreiculturibacter nitratireducens]|uniref:phasin family protein n=1 Tax=Ostreiculturibacter nitratireducens TaxID=3075226 RepID=UPI0031B5A8D5
MAETKQPKGAMPSFDDMPKQVTEMMSTMAKMQGHMFDALMRQNIEMLDFMKERFERDRKLMSQLASTEDPTEASKLWAEFWQKAAKDYSEETSKMTGMLAEVTSDTVRRMNEEAMSAMTNKAKK